MGPNFEYYRTFYFVCKYKNFTQAANILLTSQPAVSRTIRNLENEIGCQLFIRSKHGVELTPEGALLYEHVAAGCEHIFKGEAAVNSSIGLQNGIVYIGATETALHYILFDAIEIFHQKYPDVKFKIMNVTTTQAVTAVKNGTVDFTLVTSPYHIKKPVIAKQLQAFNDILIAGPKYINLKNKILHLKDLTNYPFICLAQGTTTRIFLEELFQKHNLILSPDIEPATADLILPIVRHNLGLGFVPPVLAKEDIQQGKVIQLNIKEQLPERYLSLLYNTEHPQSIAAKAFRKFILTNEIH